MLNEHLFWAKVVKTNDCWNWTGAKSSKGYGSFGVNGKIVGTHRIAYELAHGAIPTGLHVLHKCDNPYCVNPDHLFLGSNSDNVADRHKKGRSRGGIMPGSLASMAKLNEKQVVEIRILHCSGATQRLIAKNFSVHFGTINDIIRGKTWRHV